MSTEPMAVGDTQDPRSIEICLERESNMDVITLTKTSAKF